MEKAGDVAAVGRITPPQETTSAAAELILRGDPHPGAQAPTEAELAAELQISRRSARRTLDLLAAAGVVSAGVLTSPGTSAVSRLLRLAVMSAGPLDREHVIGVRVAVERTSVVAAAETAAHHDLRSLRSLVTRMRSPSLDPAEFGELDTDFHLGLARVAGGLRGTLLDGLADAVHAEMQRALTVAPDWETTARRLADEHAHLLALVTAGHGPSAAEFVTAHVERFYAPRQQEEGHRAHDH